MQSLIGADAGFGLSAPAVAELTGDFELDLAAFANQLQSFGPAGNDSVEFKLDRLPREVGTVEDFAAIEPAFVVARDLAGSSRFFAVGIAKNTILEAAGSLGELFVRFRCFFGLELLVLDRRDSRDLGTTTAVENGPDEEQRKDADLHVFYRIQRRVAAPHIPLGELMSTTVREV